MAPRREDGSSGRRQVATRQAGWQEHACGEARWSSPAPAPPPCSVRHICPCCEPAGKEGAPAAGWGIQQSREQRPTDTPAAAPPPLLPYSSLLSRPPRSPATTAASGTSGRTLRLPSCSWRCRRRRRWRGRCSACACGGTDAVHVQHMGGTAAWQAQPAGEAGAQAAPEGVPLLQPPSTNCAGRGATC